LNLDRVSAVIRPRSYPEAIDLGFCMVRAWWRPIVGAWAAAGLPLLVMLSAALYRYPELVMLLMWWLKPLFDRAPLVVLSRSLFGAGPTTAETLRGWASMLKRQLIGPLTWGRLDPLRSLRMPVRLLEEQGARARRERWRVLSRAVRGEAILLMMTCVLFEMAIFSGLLTALSSFGLFPGLAASLGEGSAFGLPLVERWLLSGCWLLAVAFVEPFYVAGGFALYVNRRTHLEAWDIEVAFRRMSARVKPGAAVVVLLLTLLTASFVQTSVTHAQEPGSAEPEALDPGTTIEQVLADPVFGGERTELTWAPRQPEEESAEQTLGLGPLAALISWLLRWLVIAVAAAFVLWGIYRIWLHAKDVRLPSKEKSEELPEEILGLDIRRESLPDDVGATARELWESGKRAEAIRLLYRATLHRLIGDGLPVRPSATEGDCLRLAAIHLPTTRQQYFQSLTGLWLLSAYGRREPEERLGSELVRDWVSVFGEIS